MRMSAGTPTLKNIWSKQQYGGTIRVCQESGIFIEKQEDIVMTVEQLYQQHIESISVAEQLELISLISRKLIAQSEVKKQRSLLELEGLGAEIWQGVDAQKYVDELRDEWNHRL